MGGMTGAGELAIRPWRAGDDLAALTRLLHRAYRSLGEAGLNYTAVDQDEATTAGRIAGNECYVALAGDRVVGTLTLHTDERERPPCACQPGMAYFSQFGDEPDVQGSGVGSRLLAHVETRARALGFSRLALDTAAPADHLVDFYGRRGYREIGRVRFAGKRYESVILARELPMEQGETRGVTQENT